MPLHPIVPRGCRARMPCHNQRDRQQAPHHITILRPHRQLSQRGCGWTVRLVAAQETAWSGETANAETRSFYLLSLLI